MIAETSSRVSGETSPLPLRTRETVAIETPASSATSRIVTRDGRLLPSRVGSARAIAPLKQVPEHSGTIVSSGLSPGLDSSERFVVNTFRKRLRTRCRVLSFRPMPGEKGQHMRFSFLPSRRLAAVLAAAGLTALAALAGAGTAPAATAASGGALAGHQCLVMTGSGDPAFVKNFNPYTATGLPSGTFVQGAFYEPLVITGEGGLKPVPWLARTWAWSNGNKTLTLNLAHGVKWSDGKPLTSADVVYSLTAGNQNAIMDRVGLTGAGNNIAAVKAKGAYTVTISLKTPDSQFIAATLNRQFVVPQHIWSKVADPATFLNPTPVGSGPFNTITRFTTQDYVFGKNPHYWQAGLPKIKCLEYVQAASNDAALALIQSGAVDWTHNFVPDVK